MSDKFRRGIRREASSGRGSSCLGLVDAACGVSLEYAPDFVPHASEYGEDFLVGSIRMSRVVESPVVTIHLPREHWASLIGISANGNDRFHILPEEFLEMLRSVAGDINADLAHHFNGLRMDVAGGPRARALHVYQVAGGRAEDSLGQVATA